MKRLITNIAYITVVSPAGDFGVRTTAHALLLVLNPDPLMGDGPRRQLRAFGTEGSWPVFDLDVSSLDYCATDWQGNAVMMHDDGRESTPIASGFDFEFKDGPTLKLWAEDHSKPLCVDECDDLAWEEIWVKLEGRVAEHWTAPNMPMTIYSSPAMIMAAREAKRRGIAGFA